MEFSDKLRDALVKTSDDPEKTAQSLNKKEIFLRERMAERRRIAEARRPKPLIDRFFDDERNKKDRSEYEAKASEWLQLADSHCHHCEGYGLLLVPRRHYPVCNCVYRAVFRRVLGKYRASDIGGRNVMVVSHHGITNSFPAQEYRADFELTCSRLLRKDPMQWYVWRLHVLDKVQWKPCIGMLEVILKKKVDRGTFFHAVYRVETTCGKELIQMLPYPLYPIDVYFSYTAMETYMVIRSLKARRSTK